MFMYSYWQVCGARGGAVGWGTALANQKVTGSIPDGVLGIFHWHNPSGRTMAPELTQPLTEISTRNISWGVKAASAYGWQPYHLHVPIVLKSGSLNLLEPSGPAQACNGIDLPFYWQAYSVLYTLCQLAFSGYPDWGVSVYFPQL